MNRREILRYTAWITGGAVSAPLAGAILSGCSEAPDESRTPVASGVAADGQVLHFFAPESFKRLALLVDTLLPRTDSPSATDVGVHVTMDSMLGLIFDAGFQAEFNTQWRALEEHLRQHSFSREKSAERVEILRALELGAGADQALARAGMLELKQQAIAYYLTTEAVGENYLNYVPIPGTYEPCISLEEANNRAWAI